MQPQSVQNKPKRVPKREFYFKVNEEIDTSDTFDCVVAVVTKKLDKLDYYHGVKDYYKAYESVPVFAMCTNHDEFFYIEDYYQEINPNIHMFTGEEEDEDEKFTREQQLTTSILNAINWCNRQYDKINQNDVIPAFNKFDKDGSGEIDREELGELSAELGHTLTPE